ncbi:EAL domain-containing protein [Sulfuricurvum sp.]|uniref:EAL domain-containing protein n=1 Tax=Sulfuricurvum sp. TaxID=2025608 RepID=UPI003C50BAC1
MKPMTLQSIISERPQALRASQTIAKALELMAKLSISSVIIVDEDNRPIGIFTEHDALRVVADAVNVENTLGEVMTKAPFCVEDTLYLHDAYLLMEEKEYRHLVVVDNEGQFSGVVSEGDFLRHIGLEQLGTFKAVSEAMNGSLLIVSPGTPLFEAAASMHERKCDYAVVLEGGKPVGVITERDIARWYTHEKELQGVTLSKMLHRDFRVVQTEASLQDAAALMEEHGVHQLIVVDGGGNLVGVLSRHDVLHAVHGAYFEFLIRVIDQKNEMITKIGERKKELKSEKDSIEKNALKLRKLFEALPDGVVLIDTVTKKSVEFNRVAHEHLGYSAEEFSQMGIGDYEAKESPEETQRRTEKIIRDGYDTFETIHRTKTGTLINVWVNVVLVMILDIPYVMAVFRDITEQKKGEHDLRERQSELANQSAFLRTLLDNIPDLIFSKDLDGAYVACNTMFERFFGAKESQIIGKTDFDFVDAELAQFFRHNDQAAIQGGKPRNNEEYLSFADKSYEGLFEVTKVPMKDGEGNVTGLLGIARDITERKKHEEELKRKDADLNAAQSLAHIGNWRLDMKQNLLEWSEETYRIFGVEIGTPLSYELFLSAIHPDDRMKVDRAWQAALRGAAYEIEHRILVKGELKWVREHAQLETDDEGHLLAGVGSVQLITERKLYEERLEMLANYDPLTGLANRALLLSHLQNTLIQAKRHKDQIALLMFDLDRFKDINDSYGHGAGDELLRSVAERFGSRLREGDLISRLGGDEFAVVLEHLAHPEDAGRLAEEMIASLSSEYKLSSGASIHIGASAGIVLFPEHGDEASTLLQHADAALYKAKAEGRGTYRYYTDALTDSARRRIECETRLRRAILNNEFEVYYQPQVHIQTGRIVGAEALIRWNDTERGIISPGVFIPIAEETGLIGDIGEWVLNETCRQGKIWLDQGYRLTLAVNLSAHQVRHQNIPLIVEAALKKSGYPADRLELELTESALMQREEEAVEMLHTLRAHGIRLAIDDFGTGYSSLSYLKRFPIDVLKIDKSFVDDIPFEADDMAIVTAIIAMGQALGFQVLAEGTERIEQIDFLREKGCTMYQGYFKSPPVPAAEFEKLLV